MADAIRKLLEREPLQGIEVVHTPALQQGWPMIETYYIGAYWGAKKEDAGARARRLAALVQTLTHVDPLFASWFKNAKSLKESLKRPLELESSALSKYVQRCMMRDDRCMPMEDLGFSVWLWNGAQGVTTPG